MEFPRTMAVHLHSNTRVRFDMIHLTCQAPPDQQRKPPALKHVMTPKAQKAEQHCPDEGQLQADGPLSACTTVRRVMQGMCGSTLAERQES